MLLRHWNFVSIKIEWTARSVFVDVNDISFNVFLIPLRIRQKSIGSSLRDLWKENKNLSNTIICPIYFHFSMASPGFPAITISAGVILPRTIFLGEKWKNNISVPWIFKVSREKILFLSLPGNVFCNANILPFNQFKIIGYLLLLWELHFQDAKENIFQVGSGRH